MLEKPSDKMHFHSAKSSVPSMHDLLQKVSKVPKNIYAKEKTIPSMKITLPLPEEDDKEIIKLSKAGMKIITTKHTKSLGLKQDG